MTIENRTAVWKIITILCCLISIGAVAFFGVDMKTPVVVPVVGHKIFMREIKLLHPSPDSIAEMKEFVDTHSAVTAVNLAAASFQQNVRSTAFYYSKIDEINKAWAADPTGQPLFTSDVFQNTRVMRLINGEFLCYRTKETAVGRLHPTLNKYSVVTCSVSIPPGYGDFIGWINIHVNEMPSAAQLNKMRTEARKMAYDIYMRDVLKKSQTHEGGSN